MERVHVVMQSTNTDNISDIVLYEKSILVFSFSLHYTFDGGRDGFLWHFDEIRSIDNVDKVICYYVDSGNTTLVDKLNSFGGELFKIDILSDNRMKVKLPFSGAEMYEESRIFSQWFSDLDGWDILEHNNFSADDELPIDAI